MLGTAPVTTSSPSTLPLDVDVLAIATAVPEHKLDQEAALEMALAYIPDFKSSASIFSNTGIATRHSCVPLAWHHEKNGWPERASVFQSAASALLETVARDLLAKSNLSPEDVGAVVVACTTGVAVPGLDVMLVNRLGLPATTERLPIFGLGCAGGVSGLARAARLAQTLERAEDRGEHVLFLAVELCTINCRNGDRSMANFVSTALFADGAAGVILRGPGVGAGSATDAAENDTHSGPAPIATLRATGEHMWEASEYVMGWSVENDGFGVVISTDIPQYARKGLRPATDAFLQRHGLSLSDITGFAFHPGGRKVLEAIEGALETDREALRHGWGVLNDYGNMSSPTALFVLERTIAEGASGRHLMGAFGPGFTVALAVLDL